MSRQSKNLKTKPKSPRKVVKKKVKSANASWREFEKLVTRIEHVLSPKGAIIKSPDHLIDKTTGEKREVDASIKFMAGTTEIVITIECRERTKLQDSLWIEQLVTKQSNIGAAKTIAVAANGFTLPAIKKAKLYGIEIRKLSKLDEASIFKWTDVTLIRTQYNYHIVDYKLRVDVNEENRENISQELKKDGVKLFDTPFCTSYNTGNKLTLRKIFENFQRKSKDKIGEVELPETGHTGVFKIDAKMPKGQIFLETSFGKFDLVGFSVDYTLYKHEELTTKPSARYTYSDEQNDLVEGIEFEIISSKGEKELLTIHKDLKDGSSKASLWRDDGK